MAAWLKFPDNSYVHMSQVSRVYVDLDADSGLWFVYVVVCGQNSPMRKSVSFATQALAQTALDNAIANGGGST